MTQHAPDGVFYYSLTIVLAMAIIAIVWAYVHRLNTTLDAIRQSIGSLVVITTSHEEKHKKHDADIEDLKKRKRGQ